MPTAFETYLEQMRERRKNRATTRSPTTGTAPGAHEPDSETDLTGKYKTNLEGQAARPEFPETDDRPQYPNQRLPDTTVTDFDSFLLNNGQSTTPTGRVALDTSAKPEDVFKSSGEDKFTSGERKAGPPATRMNPAITAQNFGNLNAQLGRWQGVGDAPDLPVGEVQVDRSQYAQTRQTASKRDDRELDVADNAATATDNFTTFLNASGTRASDTSGLMVESKLSDDSRFDATVAGTDFVQSAQGTVAEFDDFLARQSLGFNQQDIRTQIETADEEIDLLFQEQAEALGRQFALEVDPESGQAMNQFERLRSDMVREKLRRRNELRTRFEDIQRDENRQNIAAFQRADEFAASIGIDRDRFKEQARQFDIQVQESADQFAAQHGLSRDQFLQAVEQFNAGQKIADKQIEEGVRQFNAEMAQVRVDSARNFGLEEGRMQELARQFDDEMDQRASEFAARHNLSADQFLAAVDQFNAGQALANRQLEQSVIQYTSDLGQRRLEMTVQADQEQSRLSELGRQFDVTAQQRGEEFAAQHNLSRDQFLQAVDQFNAGQSLADRELEESVRQYNNDLAYRRTELSQRYGFERSQLNEQARQFDSNFKEQSRQFNSNFGLSMDQFAEGQYQFNANVARQITEFGEQMGLSRDQFNEARRQFDAGDANRDAELDEQFRQFNEQIRNEEDQFAANLGVGREQFVEAKRQFNRNMGLKETELFGGSQPVDFTQESLNEAFGSSIGDENYDERFDVDGDGTFNMYDFTKLVSNAVTMPDGSLQYQPAGRTLAAQQADNNFRIAAGQLNLSDQQVTDAKDQFDRQFNQHIQEFESNFSGMLMGEEGYPEFRYVPVAKTETWSVLQEDGSYKTETRPKSPPEYEWEQHPITALDREQFDESKRQFNERMETDVKQFLDKLQLDQQAIDDMKKDKKWNLIAGLFSSLAQSYSTIRASGNSVFSTGGKSNTTGGGFQFMPSIGFSVGGGGQSSPPGRRELFEY